MKMQARLKSNLLMSPQGQKKKFENLEITNDLSISLFIHTIHVPWPALEVILLVVLPVAKIEKKYSCTCTQN